MKKLTTQIANSIANKCVDDIIKDYLEPDHDSHRVYFLADYDLDNQDINIKQDLRQRDISVSSNNFDVVRIAIARQLNKYIKKSEKFDDDMHAMLDKDSERYQSTTPTC